MGRQTFANELLFNTCMELSRSREASSFDATREIASILSNAKFRYRLHKSPSPVIILCQINPRLYVAFCKKLIFCGE
jgi:hypothetical protein